MSPRGSERLLYHEVLHAVHHYACRQRGHITPSLPAWLREGLAEYFGYEETGRGEFMSLTAYQASDLIPLDAPQPLLQSRPNYYIFGRAMVQYLMREFGTDEVLEYAVAYRGTSGWNHEDIRLQQRFGMDQQKLLQLSVARKPEIVDQHPPLIMFLPTGSQSAIHRSAHTALRCPPTGRRWSP